jgi:hypothetical protein
VDKDKIHADEDLAREEMHGLGQKVKENTGGPIEKVKQ